MKFIFIIIFLVLFSSLISAHSTIIFHNTLDINDDSVLFSNDGSLTEVGDDYQAYIIKNIIIKNDDVPCSFGDFNYDIDPIDGFNVLVSCNSKINNLSINDSTLSGTFNVNKVYEVNVGNSKKRFVGEDILYFEVHQEQPSNANIFFNYLKLGFDHILFGFDHIFFIIGFILISTSFFSLVKNISGFTVSHSITLSLAASGLVFISPKTVEPIIALSIIVVGLMSLVNLWENKLNKFWLIFGFGIFHGLGFAGAIAEVGFPKIGFFTALLGFNLGVEAGQLLVVLIVYPLIYFISKSKNYGIYIKKFISLIIVSGGVIWLISRLFF